MGSHAKGLDAARRQPHAPPRRVQREREPFQIEALSRLGDDEELPITGLDRQRVDLDGVRRNGVRGDNATARCASDYRPRDRYSAVIIRRGRVAISRGPRPR